MTPARALLAAALLSACATASAQEALDASIPAQLVAVRQTILSAEIAGKIDHVSVREGDRFTAGQVLITLDCVIHQARLEEARATLDAAESSRAVHQRLLALNSAGTLETELAAAEAAKARAKLSSARAVVSKCAIAAPFGGRVVNRQASPHQYVQAGQPILEILDDGALEVAFIVPSARIADLAPGQDISVHVDETGLTYPATIARLGARIDPVSHSLTVAASIDGDIRGLLAGMTGRVRLDR